MRRTIALALAIGGASSAQAQPSADVLARGRLYLQVTDTITPRVHVLRQTRPNFAGVVGNVTIIEQRDGLVLIDAGASHGSGGRIVDAVRALSAKPVKAVVITHWHGDHVMGLSAILAAWPAADVIAHVNAAADIATRLPRLFPSAPSSRYEVERAAALEAAYADIERQQAAQATTREEQDGWREALQVKALRIADVPGTHVVPVKRTVQDSLLLDDPRTPVVLRHFGRANTTGDLVAWLPSERVLVTGDIVVEPTPYMIQVFPTDLEQTITRLHAFRFRHLVPGHGVPTQDGRSLDRLLALVRDVRAQVAPLAKAGVPLDSIPARTRFDRQREAFAGTNRWLAYWFDQYGLLPLIESVFNEALGRPLGPAPLPPG